MRAGTVKLLIRLLVGVGIVVILIIGAAVGMALYFDPNGRKQTIAGRFEAETGRTLIIKGPVELSYYPWLDFMFNACLFAKKI